MENGYAMNNGQFIASGPRRSWKRIVIILAVIVFIIIAGVSVFIIIRNNYENKKALAKDFYDSIGWVGYSIQCPSLINYANDNDISSVEYSSFIDSCRENDKVIQSFMSQAGSLNNSQEYKELYANLSVAISESVVTGEALEDAVEVYRIWHDWIIALKDIKNYQTPEDIEKFAEGLMQSGNDVLRAYAEKWIESREQFVEAFMTVDVLPSDQWALKEYERAKKSYQEVMNNAPDLVIITGLGRDTSNDSKSRDAVLLYRSYLEESL